MRTAHVYHLPPLHRAPARDDIGWRLVAAVWFFAFYLGWQLWRIS